MMIQPPTWWWGEDSETGNKPGEANRLVWPTLMNRWPRRGSRESVEKERETPDSGAFVVLWKSLDSPGEEEKRRGETKRRRESTTRNYSSVGDKTIHPIQHSIQSFIHSISGPLDVPSPHSLPSRRLKQPPPTLIPSPLPLISNSRPTQPTAVQSIDTRAKHQAPDLSLIEI
uniref:Uncharacterized protein n=1 Tax=Bursaphelenchus xylophilus TaxID=6326 RepID=A0A1I7RHG0_BURXY